MGGRGGMYDFSTEKLLDYNPNPFLDAPDQDIKKLLGAWMETDEGKRTLRNMGVPDAVCYPDDPFWKGFPMYCKDYAAKLSSSERKFWDTDNPDFRYDVSLGILGGIVVLYLLL